MESADSYQQSSSKDYSEPDKDYLQEHDIPVYCQNAREYSIIETEEFGKIVQMEVDELSNFLLPGGIFQLLHLIKQGLAQIAAPAANGIESADDLEQKQQMLYLVDSLLVFLKTMKKKKH